MSPSLGRQQRPRYHHRGAYIVSTRSAIDDRMAVLDNLTTHADRAAYAATDGGRSRIACRLPQLPPAPLAQPTEAWRP